MNTRTLLENLIEISPAGAVRENVPLAPYTTFRIGGEALIFVEIFDTAQLQKILCLLRKEAVPYFLLGNGSNVLIADAGFQGVVLHMGSAISEIRVEGNTIYAKAGALLGKVAKAALEAGLTGLEFASGIPGTLGGGIIMNAGAYGGELAQVVKSVEVLDAEGNIKTLSEQEMAFGYRSSAAKTKGLIVTEAVLSLTPGNPADSKALMDALAAKRREKQPLEFPSAGSTFKRPEGYFAGKLIMDAGLRGLQMGGAKVSEKHCGFVINAGGATAADVRALMETVQGEVFAQFGVMLEPEVIFVGD